MKPVYLVAEIGCNHNGSEDLAKRMIREAAGCGVNAVKLQSFKARDLISEVAPKAEYQIKTTGSADSQLAMTEKLELPYDAQERLMQYAESVGLDCFATPFDLRSAAFLYELGQKKWKIPSGEITNELLLRQVAQYAYSLNGEVILSTGMATIQEIADAVDLIIACGLRPERLTILHCNTEYPTPDEDVNVRAMVDIKRHFPDHPVGLSDHSVGSVAAIAAVALGATFIEKHFTLDKSLPGPDHLASATPEELMDLRHNVRRCETMLGEERKRVTDSERKNAAIARKSIVASRDIRKGEALSADNITCKRPGTGISPMAWSKVIGLKAPRSFKADELIELEGIPCQIQ